jgi:hypothetical protein
MGTTFGFTTSGLIAKILNRITVFPFEEWVFCLQGSNAM